MSRKFHFATAAASMAFLMAAGLASADTVTNINLSSYYNGNWGTSINGIGSPLLLNGTAIAAALNGGTGNTGSGLTFNDPTGNAVGINANNNVTISGLSIGLNSDATVNSLINNFFGDSLGSPEATLVFTNSNSNTATYVLEGGQTVRDYNNDGFLNTLTGANTTPADGNVTAQSWWNTQDASSNSDGQPSQRLDAQTFYLPASWGGTNLTSIEIEGTQIPNSVTENILSALQVDDRTPLSATPEPSETFLLAGAFAALAFFAHRRRRAA